MKHRKIFKFFAIFSSAAALSFIILTALFIVFFPKEKVSSIIVEQAENAISRKIEIGEINYSLGGIRIHDIKIHESGTTASPVMISIASSSVRFSLFSLFKEKFQLKRVYIDGAVISVVYSAAGYNLHSLIKDILKKDSTGGVTKPDIKIRNSVISLKSTEPFYLPACGDYRISTDISFDGDITEISDLQIGLPFERGSLNSDLIIVPENGKNVFSGNVVFDKFSFGWLYKIEDITSIPFTVVTGTVSAFTVRDNVLEGTASGTSEMSKGGELKADGKLRVDFAKEKISIKNASGKINGTKLKVNYLDIHIPTRTINFDTQESQIILSDVFRYLPFIPDGIDGEFNGKVSHSSSRFNIDGYLKNASYKKSRNIVTGVNSRVIVKNNIFSHENVSFTYKGKPAKISIASTDESLTNFAANIQIESTDIHDFAEIKDFSANSVSDSSSPPASVKGTFISDKMTIGSHTVSNVNFKFSKTGDNLLIPSLSFTYLEAPISGELSISNFSKNAKGSFRMRFSGMKLQKLTDIKEDLSGRIFGFAEGKIDGNFDLSQKNIRDGLNFHSEFSITTGKISDTGLQNNLGFLMSPLKHKLKDIEFNRIYGVIDGGGSKYKIRQIIFNSRDFKLSLNGEFKSDKSGDVNIKLEFSNDFIADIPNLTYTYLNKYKSGKWYTIPIKASGSDITDKANIKFVD